MKAVSPAYCQNKSIWLPSDITMIPPSLLSQHNVSLTQITQEAGEYIVVFPKAYSCSVCTAFTVSESVYFAPHYLMDNIDSVFEVVLKKITIFNIVFIFLHIPVCFKYFHELKGSVKRNN